MLSAQVAGGLAVTIVAVIPALLFPTVKRRMGLGPPARRLRLRGVLLRRARQSTRSCPAALFVYVPAIVDATGIVIPRPGEH